ncbi:hypothetical protein ACET3Z_020833 [Daucus carota]
MSTDWYSEQNLSGKCQDLNELIKKLLSNLDSITIDKGCELFKCSLNKDGPIYVLPQDPFILAPYIQNGHWMLILICLRDNIVYVFDSLNDTRNLDLQLVLSIAYRAYIVQRVRTGGNKSKLHWCDVECPQQGEITKCGYYFMRFMYDIVMEYHKNPEIKWKEV